MYELLTIMYVMWLSKCFVPRCDPVMLITYCISCIVVTLITLVTDTPHFTKL
jgi:hypothetical protein